VRVGSAKGTDPPANPTRTLYCAHPAEPSCQRASTGQVSARMLDMQGHQACGADFRTQEQKVQEDNAR